MASLSRCSAHPLDDVTDELSARKTLSSEHLKWKRQSGHCKITCQLKSIRRPLAVEEELVDLRGVVRVVEHGQAHDRTGKAVFSRLCRSLIFENRGQSATRRRKNAPTRCVNFFLNESLRHQIFFSSAPTERGREAFSARRVEFIRLRDFGQQKHHQTEHRFTGFIGDPRWHLKASANST